jgi:hypothetical protein
MSVVLPAPFGPSSAMRLLDVMSRVTPCGKQQHMLVDGSQRE